MNFHPLRIQNAYQIVFDRFKDERGFFMRSYDEVTFANQGLQTHFEQESQSVNIRKGILRGLHIQRPPFEETKLVRVINGRIFDVIAELRRDSPTFGGWVSVILSEDAHNMVYIPKGCAHGFLTLTERVVILYKMDTPFSPDHYTGVRWDDETLNIQWPVKDPIISEKDRTLPNFQQVSAYF